MERDIPRVTKVRPGSGRLLRVRFAGDRREHEIDVAGLLARSLHFAPLIHDDASFTKAVIVEDGLGGCLSIRRISLYTEGRVRFCLAHEQDLSPLENR